MNVALLFGGESAEYEISLASCARLLPILSAHHTVYPIGISRSGGWYLADGQSSALLSDSWQQTAEPLLLLPGRGIARQTGALLPIDVAFPLLHGGLGEGGGVAALLSLLHLPCVGCPPSAGMLGMDKVLSKHEAERAGVAVAPYRVVRREALASPDTAAELVRALGLPLFVKPATQGSSIGASLVESKENLTSALAEALAYDDRALCESYIEGSEVELALLEKDGALFGSLVGEIDTTAAFYDYRTKYHTKTSRIFIPARLKGSVSRRIKEAGDTLFRAFGCRGLSRVDFFVRGDEVIFNEINTMPGFTDASMYPRLMQAAGLSLPALLDCLLVGALSPSDAGGL